MIVLDRPVADLAVYARNSRTHSPDQVGQIAASIREFGFNNPVLIDGDGVIIAGHGRVLAAQALGLETVPTITLTHLSDAQRRAYVIADNQLALNAGWDFDLLRAEIETLGDDFNLDLLGFEADALTAFLSPPDPGAGGADGPKPSMADKFGIPPFSILNAREGWWQDRKRAWLARGIKSELGRGEDLTFQGEGVTSPGLNFYREKTAAEQAGAKSGPATSYDSQKTLNSIMDQRRKPAAGIGAAAATLPVGPPDAEAMPTGTSIFDPVLCELAYRWFSPTGGTILDPFAGGSVRGLVAAWLGRAYIGGDLSARQIDANRAQADDLLTDETAPVWVQGDSRTLDANLTAAGIEDQADMIFTCPPYADLEIYSDDPADLSNMPYADFLAGYREALAQAAGRLRDNRFAVVVVGEVRDPAGNYRNFVGDTVEAMRAAGLEYYNEAILVTMVGSLPIRAGKQFTAARKMGKTHQNVLVFVKGSGKAATAACGPVEFDIPAEIEKTRADGGFDVVV